jgi:hypothetical protein
MTEMRTHRGLISALQRTWSALHKTIEANLQNSLKQECESSLSAVLNIQR